MRTLKSVGIAEERRHHEGVVGGDGEEPGADGVTAGTRAFEEIDAQVFPGPGRGATRAEADASDRWGGTTPAIVEAYRHMFDLVVKHQVAHHPAGQSVVTADEPSPTAGNQSALTRGEDRRV